jgi:hypothetical protein
VFGVRITDRNNGPAGDIPATVSDTTLAFDVPCAATGGSEGDAGTAGDNTLFAVQGIFVP